MNLLLTNGNPMPNIAIGTWRFKRNGTYAIVYEAIKDGYRNIDCASCFRNEREVGRAINDCIRGGIVKREDLWITTKLWNNCHGEENVIPNLKHSLADLGLDYVDSYLINWPVVFRKDITMPVHRDEFLAPGEIPLSETWKGMEAAKGAGLARTIGVSNFNIARLEEILKDAYYKPEFNQIEIHPYLKQEKLVNFCQKNDIKLTSLATLGAFDRPSMIKKKDEPAVLLNPVLTEIATELNISNAQLIIAWLVNRGIAPVIKSTNPNHLRENLEAVNIRLSESHMNRIFSISEKYRYISSEYFEIPGSPYTHDYIFEE
ncbi:MAG: aldo/keto reductase [Marinifilaceae bacterium]|jgi:alcohol dehydrogenase (NADP+)|nr:aldo/keto reductase [Marinifilaceae bacterium]